MILPGATLGILGGGQLGRMTALAAREMGYGVVVMDPDPDCAARAVVDRVVVGDFADADAAARLAAEADVVTYEIEKIGPTALDAVRTSTPLRPGPHVLAVVQDRLSQKEWLTGHGFPVGPFRPADSLESLAAAARALGPCRAKSRRGGYDGRGQARLDAAAVAPERLDAEAARAWQAIGAAPCVVEAELTLACELSVMVARTPSGATALFPPARNWHTEGILDVSVLPGDLPDAAVAQALVHTRAMADAFGLEGLLAVEWFVTGDGVFVNELAPRPHNTFHTTRAACVTSQFEQLVRAVCDLPLGDTRAERPVALANLLGDLWRDGPPPFDRALALPGVQLHLYGKRPRPARKVGHLLAAGATAAEALDTVREARRRIGG